MGEALPQTPRFAVRLITQRLSMFHLTLSLELHAFCLIAHGKHTRIMADALNPLLVFE